MARYQLEVPAFEAEYRTDVVVVGSGAAGLSCVIELASRGVGVTLVTRGLVTDSSTDWAQGGLAAVWSEDDSTELHVRDTLVAGAGLCDEEAVRTLVTRAPGALRRLIGLGARFDTDSAGRIDLHLEGGHHARRILHAGGDQSGHEVERTLSTHLSGLDVRTGSRLIDVLTDARGRACGVDVARGGRIERIRAREVVLATGGIGQLWPTTTNPTVATGDGLAAGMRAGALARDVEFMQFHPTILVVPEGHRIPGDRGVLISEAVRGEGAFLVDASGTRVMAGVHPLADLAPRDVVSAAEHAHMHSIGADHLFLDATAFGAARWERMFPSILTMCRERGVDPVTEPIPVRPGAHYHCGGLAATMDGRTSVPGLSAIGEVACTGVQGANRLASNSLPEALVMGELAATRTAEGLGAPGDPVGHEALPLIAGGFMAHLRQAMGASMSVMRDEAGMTEVLELLGAAPATDTLTDESLTATNAVACARAVTGSAVERRESRGCHRRSDYPSRSDAWLRHLDTTTTLKEAA